jgi:hypothetical protein
MKAYLDEPETKRVFHRHDLMALALAVSTITNEEERAFLAARVSDTLSDIIDNWDSSVFFEFSNCEDLVR